MKYISEYRDSRLIHPILEEINKIITRPWSIMEICGGQTHAIMRYGIDQLLPPEIKLVHGPGCPVCVTSLELVDKAIYIASQPNIIFTSYGDMLRVPGSELDLFSVSARGGDVRVVYSPLDALQIARDNPDKEVVFFAIGFETTAPANAMSVIQAKNLGITNYSVLVSHVRVPPAMKAILSSPKNEVQGFLAAGHVCTVMGYWEYPTIADQFNVPIVVTGFEPLDILQGIKMVVGQLESNRSDVENAYNRLVTFDGNKVAQNIIKEVFLECDRKWRGIGIIPSSGWCLNQNYEEYDAETKFHTEYINPIESPKCIAGEILRGIKKPYQCSAYNIECTPEHPLGATMVSSEGACAAYYLYGIE